MLHLVHPPTPAWATSRLAARIAGAETTGLLPVPVIVGVRPASHAPTEGCNIPQHHWGESDYRLTVSQTPAPRLRVRRADFLGWCHMIVAGLVAALVAGFLVGLFAFKVKARWCPECGAMTNVERPRPVGTTAHQPTGANVNRGRYS